MVKTHVFCIFYFAKICLYYIVLFWGYHFKSCPNAVSLVFPFVCRLSFHEAIYIPSGIFVSCYTTVPVSPFLISLCHHIPSPPIRLTPSPILPLPILNLLLQNNTVNTGFQQCEHQTRFSFQLAQAVEDFGSGLIS